MSQPDSDQGIYRQLSADMQEGLRGLYHQLSDAASQAAPGAILHEASGHLDEALKATEQAAMEIMDSVEKCQSMQEESAQLLRVVDEGGATSAHVLRLRELNTALGAALAGIFAKLSFQDLAGQRIKKVLATLASMEQRVLDLYLSSGLVMAAAEQKPGTDAASLRESARKALDDFRNERQVRSELRGPDANGIGQEAIDDLLARLGK